VARRWIGVSLLAGLIGALAVAGLVLGRPSMWREPAPPTPPRVKTGAAHPAEAIAVAIRTARRRVLTFAAGCAALGVVAGVADALAEAARQAPATGRSPATAIQLLSATRWGHLWLVREAALLALAFLALALRPAIGRPRRGRDRALATGAGALVLVVVSVEALGSHAAALDSSRAAAVAAGALHVLTACLWLGALPALVLMMWPQRGGAAGPADLLVASRGPLTGLAASSLGLVMVTGLYSAGREVETVDGLVTTPYGRALLVKSTLLLVVGGLGLVNASRLHGLGRRIAASWPSRLEWRSSTRGARRDGFPSPQANGARHRSLTTTLVIIEAGAGALLLLVVGVLLESAPARGAVRPAAAPAPAAAETGSGSVADLVVTVSVTPNRPGMNGFTALAASSRRPPPAPVESVALELARGGDSSAVVLQQAPGRWFGTGRLDQGGSLRLEAVVRRAGQRLAVPVPWWVGPPVPARQAVAPEGRRLAPYVNVMALSLLAGGLALGVAWLLREGRR
jgi:copper transport protein